MFVPTRIARRPVRRYYAGEMRRSFPELQLCELDYKSHRIAINIYPAWRRDNVELIKPRRAPLHSLRQRGRRYKLPKASQSRRNIKHARNRINPVPQTTYFRLLILLPHPPLQLSPILSSTPSASSSAPPPISASAVLSPVSIAQSASALSAGPIPQASPSSVPPPSIPLLSIASQSTALPSPLDLLAATVAANKNLPIQMEVDSQLHPAIARASGPSTTTIPAATAVEAGPTVITISDPFLKSASAFLGDSAAPTTRADFISNVAKTNYIEKNKIPLPGKVQSDVFEEYFSGLTKEEKKVWKEKSKGGKKKGQSKGGMNRVYRRFHTRRADSATSILKSLDSPESVFAIAPHAIILPKVGPP
ncbi:hypothetical protein B0H14DRAFT_2564419 [Mycena olivaceomarginata]|nr:hypothetical protein B0H14DRAFT_2564419 [Mycena olivaceomarginata]